jgi:hypothetical protein
VPVEVLAQSNPFDRSDVPAFVQNFTGGTVRDDFEREYQADLYVLGAFNGKKRVDSYASSSGLERPQPLKLYGRMGPIHFANQFDSTSQGFRFAWNRRQGPSLGGRLYIGVTKTFH